MARNACPDVSEREKTLSIVTQGPMVSFLCVRLWVSHVCCSCRRLWRLPLYANPSSLLGRSPAFSHWRHSSDAYTQSMRVGIHLHTHAIAITIAIASRSTAYVTYGWTARGLG